MHGHAKRSLSVFIALVLLVSVTAGCADAYTESMRTSAKVSDSIAEGIKLFGELYDAKTIDKGEKDGALEVLIELTKGNQTFRSTVDQIHTANAAAGKADYIAAANVFLTKAGDPTTLAVFHVKNQAAQDRVTLWANSLKATLNAVTLAISKAKGK